MGQLYVPDSVKKQDATATNSADDQKTKAEHARQLLKEHAEAAAEEFKSVETAFVVFQDENGMWVGSSDIDIPIIPKRVATLHDIYAGAVSIADDVSSAKTAQHVGAMLTAQAQAMQEQMKNQALLSKLQGSGVFKK